jgi:carboxyl-terminal processing protease
LFYTGESIVKGFTLDGHKKIGYIQLPAFYGEWESVDGSGCAEDVIKEIQNLAKQQVEGMIIDLRYNGGGSLQEANQLAGLFLDDGPVGFLRQKGGFIKQMNDPYPGVLYDDPILILVNAESASASEYLAGTLQDYRRAIIVGTPTFGKASAQRFLPADTTISKVDFTRANYETKVKDEVKITVGKLYRISGKSNQLYGVQPDILLPDAFDSVEFREKSMKHCLVTDTLTRHAQYEPFKPIPIKQLAEKSAARVEASQGFKLVKQARALFAEMHHVKEKPLPLQYDKYMDLSRKYAGGARSLIKQIERDSTTDFKVKTGNEDLLKLPENAVATEASNHFCSKIINDIYIREAYAIMSDYIDLKK